MTGGGGASVSASVEYSLVMVVESSELYSSTSSDVIVTASVRVAVVCKTQEPQFQNEKHVINKTRKIRKGSVGFANLLSVCVPVCLFVCGSMCSCVCVSG